MRARPGDTRVREARFEETRQDEGPGGERDGLLKHGKDTEL